MSFDTHVFWAALFSWPIFQGALISVALTISSHAMGILLGLLLALLGAARGRPLRAFATTYIWLFRGAPTLLQLLFVWNALPQLLPVLREHWFTPFLAAWFALSLNEAAYQAEISRAALASVPGEQRDAGLALGLSRVQCFRLVILPQAIRVAIPPTANEFITLLKVTSLASVISLQELLAVTTREISVTFRFTELYAVALIYYLAIVSVLMLGQAWLEHRFGAAQAATRHTHG
ncbi:MAG TPA: amino acid ABC transporter permease [Acetobacteraceae bacterium]|nr:amino acid ABC transporter permease [Acetobacteraceae bacterium]